MSASTSQAGQRRDHAAAAVPHALLPYSGYLTLLFLLVVLVTMASDKPIGTWTVATLIIVIPALTAGWYLVRKRVMAVARERLGHTGPFPAVANPPVRSRD